MLRFTDHKSDLKINRKKMEVMVIRDATFKMNIQLHDVKLKAEHQVILDTCVAVSVDGKSAGHIKSSTG